MLVKHNCPVCDAKDVFDGEGSYDICPVCGWEDDGYQYRHPDETGANHLSLNEAKKAYRDGKAIS